MKFVTSNLVVAGFIALIFIFYGLVALRRKAKLRSLAIELGGTFLDKGLFAPGKITGNDFSLDVHCVGMGRYRRYRTTLKVSAPQAPSTYLLKTSFFENYPDWKHVKVLGTASERAFITTITFPRYLELSPDQREILLAWLGRASVDFMEVYQTLKKNRIKEITLSEASVTTTFKGIVFNVDLLRGPLNALRRLSH